MVWVDTSDPAGSVFKRYVPPAEEEEGALGAWVLCGLAMASDIDELRKEYEADFDVLSNRIQQSVTESIGGVTTQMSQLTQTAED